MRTTLETARPGAVDTVSDPPRTAVPPRPRPPRPRSGGGVFLLPPWTRAPFLPFRQPAVILAVLGAAAILACASSSAALFLSSASSESLRRILAVQCADVGYPTVQATRVVSDTTGQPEGSRRVADADVRAAMAGAGLAPPTQLRLSDQTVQVGLGAQTTGGRVLFRDGATSQITPVGRSLPGPGLWLQAGMATRLNAAVGSRVALSVSGAVDKVPARVVGIYRNLDQEAVRPYWCSSTNLFLNPSYGNDSAPPPLVIATDSATFTSLRDGYGGSSTDSWISPVSTDKITLTKARDIAAQQKKAYEALNLPQPQTLSALYSGSGQMPQFVNRTELIRAGLRGPVLPIALGGSILALLLVGAAGSYWADRRAREVRLLSSRGVGPGALALKAVLELALPAVVGMALGWLLARWLVALLGPSPVLDRAAPWQAAATALVALMAGLALLALVAGLRSRAATERPVGARRGWIAVTPWELLLLGAALGCWLKLRSGDAVTVDAGIAQINLLVVAFPLLFLVGAAVLVVRLLAGLLPRLGRAAGRLSPGWYLATRRVTASRVVSVVLLAAASTPIAVLVYAAALTQTSQYTLDAKAGVINGSTTTVQSVDPVRRTAATDAAGTVVIRYLYGKVDGQPDDVTVLAIDPQTFPATAYWDRRFADRSLADLMSLLQAPGDTVPAVAVTEDGPPFAGRFQLALGSTRLEVSTAATAHLFPGRRIPGAMLVVDRARLGDVDKFAGQLNELWSRDSTPDRAQAAVSAQQSRIYLVTSQATVFEVANFLGVSWTFGYLSALAALVGLVAVGGLLLYLETRQRSRTASYALGKRMGLTRATHLRSLLAELGVLLGLAWVVGAGLAWAAVLMVYGRLDIDPTRPPQPLLTVPVLAFAGSAAAVAVVVVLAALYAQRSADRADVSEVLRLGS
ncbi:MAG TPA: FtsX-like permease family protein [Mycobacteriales bacterium]|nr:FtsX-like permease family protein [Mycobacteriales bacterium]